MIYCGFATRCGYITKLTFIKSCQNLGKTPLLGLHSPSESHLRMLRRAIAGRSLCNGTWLRRLRGAGRPWPHQQLSTAAEHSFSSEKMAWVSLSDGLSSGDLSLRLENHHGESTTMVASLCPRLLRKKTPKHQSSGKPNAINLPFYTFGDGLYHSLMVILGMVMDLPNQG